MTATSQDGGGLTLASFDYEVSSRVEVAAEVEDDGEALVSGRLLADISPLLANAPVELELDGPKVNVTCGTSSYSLPSMPVEDYPTLPAMPETVGVIQAGEFAEAVRQVAVAATRDETLPLLTGILIEITGEHLTMLATDRYRLAIRDVTWHPANPDRQATALVRARTLQDVAKAFGHTEDITVALQQRGVNDIIGFEAAGRHATSLLIDGDYPSVRRLLPTDSPVTAVVSVPALIEAARRVAVVAERNTPLQIAFSDGQAVLNAGSGDDAKASEVIEAQLEGEDIQVAFNPNYLLEGLAVMNSPFLRISMTNSTKPVLFEGQESLDGKRDSSYRYLLVPIRFAA
jgi:DNA polymerase-3 subunit beta